MKSDRAAAELLLAAVLPSLKIINKQHLILHYIVLSIHAVKSRHFECLKK